jgi:hypothetical protein
MAGGGIVPAQQEFNVRVRRALNQLADVVNSLVGGGELSRTGGAASGGGGWTILEGDAFTTFTETLTELVEAVRAEAVGELDLWRRYFLLLLKAWVETGFPPPAGIPGEVIGLALSED